MLRSHSLVRNDGLLPSQTLQMQYAEEMPKQVRHDRMHHTDLAVTDVTAVLRCKPYEFSRCENIGISVKAEGESGSETALICRRSYKATSLADPSQNLASQEGVCPPLAQTD